jgi:hypothetical protein
MRRPAFLTGVMLLLAIGNVAGLSTALLSPETFQTPYPRLIQVWPMYLLCPVVTLVGLWGVWRWERWGVWLVAAMALVALVIEAWTMGPTIKLARVPVACALLYLSVRPVWMHFR